MMNKKVLLVIIFFILILGISDLLFVKKTPTKETFIPRINITFNPHLRRIRNYLGKSWNSFHRRVRYILKKNRWI